MKFKSWTPLVKLSESFKAGAMVIPSALKPSPTGSALSNVALVLLACLVFSPLAFQRVGLLDLVGITALLLILLLLKRISLPLHYSSFVDPFTPFALFSLVVGLASPDRRIGYTLLAVVSAYFFANLLRVLLPPTTIMSALSWCGIGLGLLGITENDWVATPELLASLESNLGGKNVVAAAVVIGIMSRLTLSLRPGLTRGAVLLSILHLTTSLVLLVLLGSLAALFCAIILLSISWAYIIRISRVCEANLSSVHTLFLGAAIVTSVLAIGFANLGRASDWLEDGLGRNFFTLNGRVLIWSCYLSSAGEGSDLTWRLTQDCLPFQAAHLHNIFLEAHLAGGPLLFGALVLGIISLGSYGLWGFLKGRNSTRLISSHLALNLAVVSITLGSFESLIFYPTSYFAIGLFVLAPHLSAVRGVPDS